MLLHWPKLLYHYYSLLLVFLSLISVYRLVLWAGVFRLIGCTSLSLSLALLTFFNNNNGQQPHSNFGWWNASYPSRTHGAIPQARGIPSWHNNTGRPNPLNPATLINDAYPRPGSLVSEHNNKSYRDKAAVFFQTWIFIMMYHVTTLHQHQPLFIPQNCSLLHLIESLKPLHCTMTMAYWCLPGEFLMCWETKIIKQLIKP